MDNFPVQSIFNMPIQRTIAKPSLPLQAVRHRADMAADTDSGDSDEEDRNLDDFRSPTKRMGLTTNSTLPSGQPTALMLPNSHTPREILIQTPTLKQLGMKYNTKYDLVVCMEYWAGYLFHSFYKHAQTSKMQIINYDTIMEKYVQVNPCPTHSRPPLKRGPSARVKGNMTQGKVEALILTELEGLGYNPSPHFAETQSGGSHEEWVHLAVPRPDQQGPINGIRSYLHGFRCAQGECANEPFPYCSVTDHPMWMHFKNAHPQVYYRFSHLIVSGGICKGVTLQTLCAVKSYMCYFEVPSGGAPSLDLPISNISLVEILLQEQAELYGDLTGDKGLDTELIDPVYSITGMVEFWRTFDFATIRPLQEIISIRNVKNFPKDHQVIARAVVATFLEISLYAKTGSTAVLHLITQGAG